jgi:hypothetical protein
VESTESLGRGLARTRIGDAGKIRRSVDHDVYTDPGNAY